MMANPPGRPPLDRTDRSVVVCVAMPGRVFDRVHRRAQVERVTVPELLRRVLRQSERKNIQTSDS